MAEEFVRIVQFGEFVKRIEERFEHLGKELVNVNTLADQRYDSINQRLADAEKARDQNAVHVNQRFDDMNRSVNQRFDDMDRSINHRFDGPGETNCIPEQDRARNSGRDCAGCDEVLVFSGVIET